jgi:hypothetical protein
MGHIAVALTAIGAACSTTDGLVDEGGNGGSSEPAVASGRCPEAGPPNGTTCLLPEGTTCLFDSCGTSIAQCRRGTWAYSTVDHRPACPEQVPDIDEPCPACWRPGATCIYGSLDCAQADASGGSRATASCEPGGRWAVLIEPCRDGGADVQGD